MRVENQYGIDQLQGLGSGLSMLQAIETLIVYASTSLHPVVDDADTLTVVIDNHNTASAVVRVVLYLASGV